MIPFDRKNEDCINLCILSKKVTNSDNNYKLVTIHCFIVNAFIFEIDVLKQNSTSKYNIVNLCGLCRMFFMPHKASLNTKL